MSINFCLFFTKTLLSKHEKNLNLITDLTNLNAVTCQTCKLQIQWNEGNLFRPNDNNKRYFVVCIKGAVA